MRITREHMFFGIARLVAARSTCPRASVGAIVVRDGRILSTGYNGAPPGQPHCEEVGCEFWLDTSGCQRTIHAEANAIAWAARAGVATEGAVMYCTHSPCLDCAKLMVSSGIWAVHYHYKYREEAGVQLLRQLGVEVIAQDD